MGPGRTSVKVRPILKGDWGRANQHFGAPWAFERRRRAKITAKVEKLARLFERLQTIEVTIDLEHEETPRSTSWFPPWQARFRGDREWRELDGRAWTGRFIKWNTNFANTRKRFRTITARPAGRSRPRQPRAKKSSELLCRGSGSGAPASRAGGLNRLVPLAAKPPRCEPCYLADAAPRRSGLAMVGRKEQSAAMKFSDFVSAGAIRAESARG